MKKYIALVIPVVFIFELGCSPQFEAGNSEEIVEYIDVNDNGFIKSKALHFRLEKMSQNYPDLDQLDNLVCDSLSIDDFNISNNVLNLYFFYPNFIDQFHPDYDGEFSELDELREKDSVEWFDSQDYNQLELETFWKLNDVENWDSIPTTGANFLYCQGLAEVEALYAQGNIAVVYPQVSIKAEIEKESEFSTGLLYGRVVFYNTEMEPICSFDVAVLNDDQIEYSYFEGQDLNTVIQSNAQADLQYNFYESVQNQLKTKLFGPIENWTFEQKMLRVSCH